MQNLSIKKAIKEGWNMFNKNMGIALIFAMFWSVFSLVVFSFLMAVFILAYPFAEFVFIAYGLCLTPFICGFFQVIQGLFQGTSTKPGPWDVFHGYKKENMFYPFCLYTVVTITTFCLFNFFIAIPLIGQIISFLIILFYGPIIKWSLMLITLKKMKPFEAFKTVVNGFFDGTLGRGILLSWVADIIAFLGIFGLLFGVLFTYPLSLFIYTSAYNQVFKETDGSEPIEPIIEGKEEAK